jgi:prolyl oligopeptidase
MDPWFCPSILTFLCRYGGIFALVHIRGGGEFGEKWHLAGIREHKVWFYYISGTFMDGSVGKVF